MRAVVGVLLVCIVGLAAALDRSYLLQPHTTVECRDAAPFDGGDFVDLPVPLSWTAARRTCLYRNVYMHNGRYFALLGGGVNASQWAADTELYMYGDFVGLSSMAVGQAELFAGKRVRRVEGLSVPVRGLWTFNIAHMLFDGLYPAFVSLLRWGVHDANFTAVYDALDDCRCMSDAVVAQFSGRPLLDVRLMDSPAVVYRFDQLVVGQGLSGQRYLNNRFALPYGRELNATRLFRERLLRRHGVQPGTGDKIIVVDNKRYTPRERQTLGAVVASLVRRGYNAEYVDWATVPSFAAQMAIVNDCRVYVSGPGTGLFYHPFMPDASAVVNLGTVEWAQCRDWPSAGDDEATCFGAYVEYMEEYVVEGCPYQRGYYYPARERLAASLSAAVVERLVLRALADVSALPWRDSRPGESMSINARVLRDYCAADLLSCQKLLHSVSNVLPQRITLIDGSAHTNPQHCMASAWYGPVVAEMRHYSPHGWHNLDKNTVEPACLWNRDLLVAVKRKYAAQLGVSQ